METAEFQIRSGMIGTIPQLKRYPVTDETTETPAPAQPLSLITNFGLHGSLTDSDRKWLDAVLPGDTLCFLIHGEKYLHPENTPLFPIEVIESSMLDCGASFFSQRFFPKSDKSGASFRILTTSVGSFGGRSLIFGLFGRENLVDDIRTEVIFSDAVTTLRQAALALPELMTRLSSTFHSDEPCCIIDRPNGLILAANSAFSKLVQVDTQTVAGRSFTDIAADFPAHFGDGRLRIQNSTVAGFAVSILTIGDSAIIESPAEISRFYFHKLRNKLSSIMTSASYLQSLYAGNDEVDESALAAVIANESVEMEREMSRFELITGFAELPQIKQNVCAALRQCMGTQDSASRWSLQTSDSIIHAELSAPENTLKHIVEAITHIHEPVSDDGTIACSKNADGILTRIQFTSTTRHRPKESPVYWTTFLRQLCSLAGYTIECLAQERDTIVTTVLTLPHIQELP